MVSSRSPRSKQLSPRLAEVASVDSSWNGGDGSVTVGESTHKSVATNTTSCSGGIGGESVSMVESVIGHDDPTLLHTNINGRGAYHDDDSISFPGIKSTMTNATLGSLVSAETENRDASSSFAPLPSSSSCSSRGQCAAGTVGSNVSERGTGVSGDRDMHELQQQLNELDRAVQQTTADMDSTEAFYVTEAGNNDGPRKSPRRKRSPRPTGFTIEQTILEEDGDVDEHVQEKEELQQEHSRQPKTGTAVTSSSNIPFSRTAKRAAERSKRSGYPDLKAQSTPHLVASSKTCFVPIESPPAEEAEDKQQQQYQEKHEGSTSSLCDNVNNSEDDEINELLSQDDENDELDDIYDNSGMVTDDNEEQSTSDDDDDERRLGHFHSDAASIGQSEGSSVVNSNASDLMYTYPSSMDHSDDGGQINDPSQRTYENEMVRPRPDEDPEDVTEDREADKEEDIVREVQRRLNDLSSNNLTSTELPLGNNEQLKPLSVRKKWYLQHWIPVGDGSVRTTDSRAGILVQTNSLRDNINADEASRIHDRRRRRLCILNVLVCVIVAAVLVLSVFLALNLTSTSKSNTATVDSQSPSSQTQRSQQPTAATPTFPAASPVERRPTETTQVESPIEPQPVEQPVAASAPTQGSNLPATKAPVGGSALSQITTPTMSPTKIPTSIPTELGATEPTVFTTTVAPSTSAGSAEERVLAISGDVIYDESTPQYKAWNWLANEDPAKLDLNAVSDVELNQRYVSALVYFSLGGDAWLDNLNFLSEKSVCEWNDGSDVNSRGIICDNSDIPAISFASQEGPIVLAFSINENNLKGKLPIELQVLSGLKSLQLRANMITGSLPSEIGTLSLLEELDLRQNMLEGTMPSSVFELPKLKRLLLLSNNKLSGKIPETVNRASNLEMLSFQRCQLTGTIPESVGDLSSLFFFTFMDNRLSGTIPERLTKLQLLEVLELSGNELTGTIPQFASQTELYFVSLGSNKLTGTVPASIADLSGLLFLDLRDNNLSGSIPPELGQLPELVTLFVQNNQLTGPFPSFSGNRGLLQGVDLSNNRLSGALTSFFEPNGPTLRLSSVQLGNNSLTGPIPTSIANFASLTELDLANNNLTGNLPVELSDLSNLNVINLASNSLVGTIPSALQQLRFLDELHLNDNGFTGDLTATFCNVDPTNGAGTTTAAITRGDNNNNPIDVFVGDCLGPEPLVTCECCTSCCDDELCEPN